MNRFFNYNNPYIARLYDRMRRPHGVDVISGLLQVHCRKPLQNIHLLDAGGGTGQHAQALLEMGLGKITVLDASPEMLTVAKEKLNKAIKDKTANIVEASFPGFPFQDKTFDAVMFNQSLHHLDSLRDGQNYPKLEETLEDTHRILRKNGILIISTVLSTTVRESIWFLHLQPGIREKLAKTHLSANQYMDMFDKHGFQCSTAMNLLTATGANIYLNYLNPEAPLDEDWRQASNMFGIATDLEIKEMESVIREMKQNGTLETFMKENDHTHERGFVTLFACISRRCGIK